MTRKMLSCFLCLFFFLLISDCKKSPPTGPDIPELLLPRIVYFTSSPTSMKLGESSTLSWSSSNVTTVTIDHGIGSVPVTGTVEVSPGETTTYTLTASNSDGQSSLSCMVMIKRWAILTIETIPTNPIFYYYPTNDTCYSDFAVVVRETNGVGGQLEYVHIYGWENEWTTCTMKHVVGGIFSANGSFTTPSLWVFFACKAMMYQIVIKGEDMNGYAIDLSVWYTIAWTQARGTVTYLKTVKGPNHHKRIK